MQRVKGKYKPHLSPKPSALNQVAGSLGYRSGMRRGQYREHELSGTYQLKHHGNALPGGLPDVLTTIHQALVTLKGTVYPLSLH